MKLNKDFINVALTQSGLKFRIDVMSGFTPFLILFFVFSAQAKTILSLEKVTVHDLPKLTIESGSAGKNTKIAFETALKRQLKKCQSQDESEVWNFGTKKTTRKQWCIKTAEWFLEKIKTSSSLDQVYQAAKVELEWYRSTGNPKAKEKNEVLFTGYYQPTLKVKRKKDSVYRYPIYRTPKNPRVTRKQIVNGALKGQHLEIAYAASPIDTYIMEVQGPGELMIQNDDHTQTRLLIAFDDQNHFKYTSLRKIMLAEGVEEKYTSVVGMRAYFAAHPDRWEHFSNQNESYVFFREVKAGPIGAAGVVLTPEHSIAVDPSRFPLGAIALMQSEKLDPHCRNSDVVCLADAWYEFAQFAIAQDTGGSIKGAGHVDVYWGSGDYAAEVAGRSKQYGQLFFCLVPDATQSAVE